LPSGNGDQRFRLSGVTALPSLLDAYVPEDNPVRVIDVLVDELNLRLLCFASMMPAGTGTLTHQTGPR
jgi:transposase